MRPIDTLQIYTMVLSAICLISYIAGRVNQLWQEHTHNWAYPAPRYNSIDMRIEKLTCFQSTGPKTSAVERALRPSDQGLVLENELGFTTR